MHAARDTSANPKPFSEKDLYGRPHCEKKHDGASYVWLGYSIFFFIEPVLRNQLGYWLRQAGFYLVFLALYIAYVEFTERRARLAIIAGIFAVGVLTIPVNTGASCFFIYVAALLPFCVESSSIFLAVILAELVALLVESLFFPGSRLNYLMTGCFAVIVGVSNLFVAQGKRADQKLRHAQAENVELAAVAERERIARDLHDVLGHTLSVIVLKAELAGRLLGSGNQETQARAAAEIADVERTARAALAEVREAIGGYRAKGLSAEIEHARDTLSAAGVTLTCVAPAPSLRAREETVLSLAVREAVTNIVRHAGATRCTLHFATSADGFTLLEVTDNGHAASTASIATEGNGLRGMRERVQALGGRLRIESGAVEGQGTRLILELPRSSFREASEPILVSEA